MYLFITKLINLFLILYINLDVFIYYKIIFLFLILYINLDVFIYYKINFTIFNS